MLTHHSICCNLAQFKHPDMITYRPDAPNVGLLPWYHIYGFTVILAGTLHVGGHSITMQRFDTESFLESVEKYRVIFNVISSTIITYYVLNLIQLLYLLCYDLVES